MSKYNHPLDRASNSIPNDMVYIDKDTYLSIPVAVIKACIRTHDSFMENNKENITPATLKHLTTLRDDLNLVEGQLRKAFRVKLRVEVTLQ